MKLPRWEAEDRFYNMSHCRFEAVVAAHLPIEGTDAGDGGARGGDGHLPLCDDDAHSHDGTSDEAGEGSADEDGDDDGVGGDDDVRGLRRSDNEVLLMRHTLLHALPVLGYIVFLACAAEDDEGSTAPALH